MKISELFATSEKLENEGVWFPMGGSARIRVARFGNKASEKLSQRLYAPYRAQLRTNNVPKDIQEKIAAEVMAKTILVDWENVDDEDGKPLPYSHDAALAQLTKHPEFNKYVFALSNDMANFREASAEDAAKN